MQREGRGQAAAIVDGRAQVRLLHKEKMSSARSRSLCLSGEGEEVSVWRILTQKNQPRHYQGRPRQTSCYGVETANRG